MEHSDSGWAGPPCPAAPPTSLSLGVGGGGEGVPGAQPHPSADVGAAVGGKAAHTDLLEPIKFAEILQTSC